LSTDCSSRARSVSLGWQAEKCTPHWLDVTWLPLLGDNRRSITLITTEIFMAGETTITLVGNLTADPELRFTPSGAAVANFTVASTPRTFDRQTNEWRDGDAMFLNCAVWRQAAENVAESLQKGMRVIVQGRLKSRSYETRDGDRRTVFEIDVDEIGPALRYATAKVTRNVSGSNQGGGYNRPAAGGTGDDPWAGGTPSAAGARSQQGSDPWATPQSDEPPF
jgi:single-strand DNA-binding protein